MASILEEVVYQQPDLLRHLQGSLTGILAVLWDHLEK